LDLFPGKNLDSLDTPDPCGIGSSTGYIPRGAMRKSLFFQEKPIPGVKKLQGEFGGSASAFPVRINRLGNQNSQDPQEPDEYGQKHHGIQNFFYRRRQGD
jgi:hypothetical protein